MSRYGLSKKKKPKYTYVLPTYQVNSMKVNEGK